MSDKTGFVALWKEVPWDLYKNWRTPYMEGWDGSITGWSQFASQFTPTGGDHLTHLSYYGYSLWGWRLWVCSLDLKFHISKHSPGELHT